MDLHVVIIGGGIAGLTAAHRLRCLSPQLGITLIEREPLAGGKIVTERVDGFVIEGGPDSFLSSKPWGVALCEELRLGDRLQETREETRRSFVLRAGTLHRIPEGLSGLVPARLEPLMASDLLSPAARERLALEPSVAPRPGSGDESLAAFVIRRFGLEVYERLIEPLMSGIYAGDGYELSLEATFPQLRRLELEHGSVLAGMRASAAAPGGKQRAGFLAPRAGMAELVEGLLSRLRDVRCLTGVEAAQVSRGRNGYTVRLASGETMVSDAVIVATPAHASASLLSELDGDLASALQAIPHVSTATVALAFPARSLASPLEGHGYIVPRAEGRLALACTWVSSKFDHRAPPDRVLLRVFFGRAGQEEEPAGSDDDLLELARTELREVLGIHGAPLLWRVRRWPAGMPQYTLGHLDRLAAIERRLDAYPGLVLAGNAFRGVGIPDCIRSGEAAALAALSALNAA